MMVGSIIGFELRYWLRNPLPYVFGFIIGVLAFATLWGMAIDADPDSASQVLNSPYGIYNKLKYFYLLFILVIPSVVGHAVYRDFDNRIHLLLYSFPIMRKAFISGKFLSSLFVCIMVAIFIEWAFAAGGLIPNLDPQIMNSYRIADFTIHFLLIIFINTLVISVFVFWLVLLTRNILAGFIFPILIVMFQLILFTQLNAVESNWILALADPLGEYAVFDSTRYWSAEDQNFKQLPLSLMFIVNRIFWLLIATFLSLIAYRRFEFIHIRRGRNNSRRTEAYITQRANIPSKISLPEAALSFQLKDQLITIWLISNFYLKKILFSRTFILLLLGGIIFITFQQYQITPQDGVLRFPTTANMLQLPLFIFSGFVTLLTFLYTGTLIHMPWNTQMNELVATSPYSNYFMLFTKLLAIVKLQILMLTLVMVGGIVTQLLSGYNHIELWHYIFELYFLTGLHLLIWACLALFIHTLANNIYLGLFLLIMISLSGSIMPEVANFLDAPFLSSPLLNFNQVKDHNLGFTYSAITGYGNQLPNYLLYKTYWLSIASVLILVSGLCWRRMHILTVTRRIQEAWRRIEKPSIISFIGLLLVANLTGGWIYYSERHLSRVLFSQQQREHLAFINEKEFGEYRHLIQPQLSAVNLSVDIYPHKLRYELNGSLSYVNRTGKIIDTLLVAKSLKDETLIEVLNPHRRLKKNEKLRYELFSLNKPMYPNDTLEINVSVRTTTGMSYLTNDRVFHNGTYLEKSILPVLGPRDAYLTNNKTRKKYGLPALNQYEDAVGSKLLNYLNIENNMSQFTYECIVSTTVEQIGFTMGNLQDSWQNNNRSYFHYKADLSYDSNLAWVSGDFVKEDTTVSGIQISMYRHHEHDRNVDRLFSGAKTSLLWHQKHYGPLGHDTLRVIEFPVSKGTYATLSGNLVLISESYFLCDPDSRKNTLNDLPLFVTAHELSHYWWGHQLDPANVPGGRFISEGLANYNALCILEEEDQNIASEYRLRFYKTYMDFHRNQRDEKPLIMAPLENESLNYLKSSLAFYGLSKYIGKERLQKSIAEFYSKYRQTGPPFVAAQDLTDHLRSTTPDSLKYLIHDYFEAVTVYDNMITEVEVINNNSQGMLIELTMEVNKKTLQHESNSTEPLSNHPNFVPNKVEYVRLTFMDKQDNIIRKEFAPVSIGINKIRVASDVPFKTIVLDEELLLFDINLENNRFTLGEQDFK